MHQQIDLEEARAFHRVTLRIKSWIRSKLKQYSNEAQQVQEGSNAVMNAPGKPENNNAMLSSVEKRHQETHIPELKARIQPIYEDLKPLIDQYWSNRQIQNRGIVSSYTHEWGNDFKNFVSDAFKGLIKTYPLAGAINSLNSLEIYKKDLGDKNYGKIEGFIKIHQGDLNFFADLHAYLVARIEAEKLENDINILVDRTNVSEHFEELSIEGKLERAKPLLLEDFKKLDDGRIYAHYVRQAKEAILRGNYVPQLLFAGKATRLNRGAMYFVDVWELAKELGVELQDGDGDYTFGMAQDSF